MDKKKKKRLWVTIDTEMDADIHWAKKWPPKYSSVCLGIPKYLRPIWDQYDVHPVYFVSPEVLYSDACCRVLRKEIKLGAVIGAHLHPEYIGPDAQWGNGMGRIEPQFPNSGCPTAVEYQKIENLTRLIEKKLGVKPIWYRGARFGADIDTVHALDQLGYRYDSSVTPCIDWSDKGGPDHSRAPQERYYIDAHDFYKSAQKGRVAEVPVTVIGKRWGIIGRMLPDHWLFYRWLRPTHMTYLEMRRLVRQLRDRNELVMMFHSMEVMVNRTPYVRTEWMQKYYLWRLRRIIGYAVREGYSA